MKYNIQISFCMNWVNTLLKVFSKMVGEYYKPSSQNRDVEFCDAVKWRVYKYLGSQEHLTL